MKILLAAIRALFGALGGWGAGLARHAGASWRVTAEGARALGIKFGPAVKAGAARAGGGVKHSIFALPGKIVHTLRGKLVEVAITLALTTGIAYWLSDAQIIRSEPIACWFSDSMSNLFGARAPLKPGEGFRVLVAQLDGDDAGIFTHNVALSFDGVKGIEVRELCGSLGVPKGAAMTQGWRDAEATARDWLASWHADVIVWGMPAPGERVRLYITTPTNSGALKLYQFSEEAGFLLPAAFDQDFAAQVLAFVLNGIEVTPAEQGMALPIKFSELLVERMPQLKALALARGKSFEATLSSATAYFAAFQRVWLEDSRLDIDPPRVNPDDALAVLDGLSKGVDGASSPALWAAATMLETTAKVQIFATRDDVDGLRATIAQLEHFAGVAGMDERLVDAALTNAGMSYDVLARIRYSRDDMHKALSLFNAAKRQGRGGAGSALNVSFAMSAQWLWHEMGEGENLQEALELTEAALKSIPADDVVRRVQVELMRADLQAGLAEARFDLAGLRQAIGAFDRTLTPDALREVRPFYVMGLEQRFDALEFLALQTWEAGDFGRAADDATRVLQLVSPEKLDKRLDISRRRGALMVEWGGLTGDTARLQGAIADLNKALEGVAKEKILPDWCGIRSTVARATWLLEKTGALADGGAQALAMLGEVERVARGFHAPTAERARADRAEVLGGMADLRSDPARAREAAALLRDIIAAVPRDKEPVRWATFQSQLGTVLLNLGDIAHEGAAYRDAAQAFKNALTERTRARDRGAWAGTGSLAVIALTRQGEDFRDRKTLDEAVALAAELREASAGGPDALLAARAAAFANTALALFTKDQAAAERVRADMKGALGGIDRNAQRFDWAFTRLRYGEASMAVGALTNDAATIGEGVAAVIEARAIGVKLNARPLMRAADIALDKAPSAAKAPR